MQKVLVSWFVAIVLLMGDPFIRDAADSRTPHSHFTLRPSRPSHQPFFTLKIFSNVTTKYQDAAKIVNLALQGLVAQCLPGKKVIELCEFGHTVINQACAKLYTKKVNGQLIDRGIAFPVCISVNDVVCNHSPLLSEERVRSSSGMS